MHLSEVYFCNLCNVNVIGHIGNILHEYDERGIIESNIIIEVEYCL